MACGPVNFQGRTLDVPCLGGWLGSSCTWDDYSAVRRTLLAENNALVRSLNAFNKVVGTKTNAKRWSKAGIGYKGQVTPAGIITWDTATSAAYELQEDAYELLGKYPDSYVATVFDWDLEALQGPVVSMMHMAMRTHSATCDVDDALVAAGVIVPQKPEAPPPEKTLAQELLDFSLTAAKGVATFVGLGLLGLAGYNYFTAKKGNRW